MVGAERRRTAFAAALIVVGVGVAIAQASNPAHRQSSTPAQGATRSAAPGPSRPASPSSISAGGSVDGRAAPSSIGAPSTAPKPDHRASHAPIFAIYYMWWDRQHWITRLGPRYPSSTPPNPLPAALDNSSCGAVTHYPGNQLTDVSQGLRYDQADPATIRADVELAARSGLDGFVVNWIGTGRPGQRAASSKLNQRLKYMVDAVHRVNAEGRHFSLMLNYQSSAKHLSLSQFTNDLDYFLSAYRHDIALDHSYSARPEVVLAGTWKYSDADIESISTQFRSHLYLIGDEKPSSWDAARARSLDGASYYWSSQNPITNASSFDTIRNFGATVRQAPNPDGSKKTWLAPFTPGYNAVLLYHTPTCVPRNNGATMRTIFRGNAASKPDGWTLISWNEISEGSYVVPLTRYGAKYIETLKVLAHNNG